MVYKNGIKEWAIVCCSGGLLYGLFTGLFTGVYKDNWFMTSGITAGLFYGVVFTLLMALFSKHIEKKSEHLRAEISKVRKIICEGPANHQKGTNGIGGWLFLSEDAVEFYPHKMNIGGQNIPILIDDITNIETKFNRLKIHTKTSGTYTFVVNKANLWKQSIVEIL